MLTATKTGRWLYRTCIAPQSKDPDASRREYILNVLLIGLTAAASGAFLLATFDYFILGIGDHLTSVIATLFFLGVMSGLLLLSRRGKPALASVILVSFLLASGLQLTLAWGFGLATAELLLALTIVVAGVLFSASFALIAMSLVAALLVAVTYLQVMNIQHPSIDWQQEPLRSTDVIGYLIIFMMMGVVSWLANRQTQLSLRRAHLSERDLQKERDNLEAKVVARTRELEDLQLARLLEIQPFAEFGRIGASLIHDIANPLTAATLQLEEVGRGKQSESVRQVQRSLRQLERYLVAARKQIKRQSDLRIFSVSTEAKQVVHLLTNRARRSDIRLSIIKADNVKLYGDAVKFNQLIANLLANAIEATETKDAAIARPVELAIESVEDGAKIIVVDHGIGIKEEDIDRLFEPFYSTKSLDRSGFGLGLALVKQYVEHDFHGTITVSSSHNEGTTCVVYLKGQEKQ